MSDVLKFRKKPVVVAAIQWTGENLREVISFTDGPPKTRSNHAGMMWEKYEDLVKRDGLKIFTLEGPMMASVGDWIIKGVKGEFYPCKPDIFEKTYEPVTLKLFLGKPSVTGTAANPATDGAADAGDMSPAGTSTGTKTLSPNRANN